MRKIDAQIEVNTQIANQFRDKQAALETECERVLLETELLKVELETETKLHDTFIAQIHTQSAEREKDNAILNRRLNARMLELQTQRVQLEAAVKDAAARTEQLRLEAEAAQQDAESGGGCIIL
jgi:hypothetical protein